MRQRLSLRLMISVVGPAIVPVAVGALHASGLGDRAEDRHLDLALEGHLGAGEHRAGARLDLVGADVVGAGGELALDLEQPGPRRRRLHLAEEHVVDIDPHVLRRHRRAGDEQRAGGLGLDRGHRDDRA